MRRLLPACLALLAVSPLAHAEDPTTLTVAAAANLAGVIVPLDAEFERQHPGVTVKVSTGASGNFFAQIKNGAPFEVFVSADTDYPKKLIDEKLAVPASFNHYADGQLALWTTNPKVDLGKGLAVLGTPVVKKIAIANPDTAPYGRAAKAVLENARLTEKTRDKLVVGENIAQALQFVQTGNAEAGFVAFSLLKSLQVQDPKSPQGRYELLPESSHPPIEQAAVVTQKGVSNALAADYVKFLSSPEARTLFLDYGYALPAAAK